MKFRALFNLIQDTQDLLDCFEGVETAEQMTSRLERLKREAPRVLEDVYSLRLSLETILNEMLELGGPAIESGDAEDAISDDLLDGLGDEGSSTDEPGEDLPPEAAATPNKS